MKDLSEIREHYSKLELDEVEAKVAEEKAKLEARYSESDLTEGPYVASYMVIFDIILKDLKKEMEEAYKKGKIEIINNIARLAKHKVSDKEQQKGKLWLNNKGN